jgi:hypothetical protein
MTLADQLEAQIRANRLLRLPVTWKDEFIYPHYAGLSIYNLSQTIAALFGAPAETPLDKAVWQGEAPFGQVDRVVVIITDGLGYRLLKRFMQEDAQIADLTASITEGREVTPLTSVAPSTTACALPTFWTAHHPGEHGMLGTALFLGDAGTLADMLRFSPGAASRSQNPFPLDHWGFPADRFIPVPSLAEQLPVPLHLVIGQGLFGTGLSRMMHRGVHKHYAYYTDGDAFPRLQEVLVQTAGQRCCITLYLPNIDALSHAYGHASPQVKTEVTRQLSALYRLLQNEAARDGRTLVMLTADHGHYDAPGAIDLVQDGRLQPVRKAMRTYFGGDERFGYLYLREGTRRQVMQVFGEQFCEQAAVIETEAVVEAGLFGKGSHPDLLHRAGDMIVLVRQEWRLVDGARPPRTVSIHAGLSAHEMLVPLLWNRI